MISESLFLISTKQAIFLAVLYSFFNSIDGQQLLEKLQCPNLVDIPANLSGEHLDVILTLMANYSGW